MPRTRSSPTSPYGVGRPSSSTTDTAYSGAARPIEPGTPRVQQVAHDRVRDRLGHPEPADHGHAAGERAGDDRAVAPAAERSAGRGPAGPRARAGRRRRPRSTSRRARPRCPRTGSRRTSAGAPPCRRTTARRGRSRTARWCGTAAGARGSRPPGPSPWWAAPTWPAHRQLACDQTTALGRAVVPDVYWMLAASDHSGERGYGAGSRTRQGVEVVDHPGRRGRGRPRPAARSGVVHHEVRLAVAERVARARRVVSRGSRQTATAPMVAAARPGEQERRAVGQHQREPVPRAHARGVQRRRRARCTSRGELAPGSRSGRLVERRPDQERPVRRALGPGVDQPADVAAEGRGSARRPLEVLDREELREAVLAHLHAGAGLLGADPRHVGPPGPAAVDRDRAGLEPVRDRERLARARPRPAR